MTTPLPPRPGNGGADSGLHPDHVFALVEGRHPDPHDALGVHAVGDKWIVRVVRPLAASVTVTTAGGVTTTLRHAAQGLWVGALPGEVDGPSPAYTVTASYEGAPDFTTDDPYRFPPTLGEIDLHLWGEGRHERLWDVLGAHLTVIDDVEGCAFAVWAPHAQAVRVLGDLNGWNGVGHAMRRLGSGVWELFVPGVLENSGYKFEILTADGSWVTRADPMARWTEVPPATAARTVVSRFAWDDSDWMTRRAATNPHRQPMSTYEVHLGSWRTELTDYRAMADALAEYVTWLGFTHVELMPVAEHPFGGSWGYQVTGYYAPTSRFGHPDDLKYLIDTLHRAGIGVILDWVPGHFPKDEWALARFDGQALYEHADPRRGEQPDWGTYVFNFGDSQVRNFLVANALYWLEEFHIDGLRVDAVASMLYLDYSRKDGEWLPNQYGGRENLEAVSFLQEANATAYKHHPGIVMIAEESTSWPGVTRPTNESGLGFGMKWNMGWMHDSLEYVQREPIYRSHHHNEITFSFMYAFSENFVLPISHDEVVHGKGSLASKMPGDHFQKLANVRAYLGFQWAHPGKQLLFMGQEFAQLSEWSEQRGLDWWLLDQPTHRQLAEYVGAINRVSRDHAPLWQLDDESAGFQWIDGGNGGQNLLAFLRLDEAGNPIACVFNFSGVAVRDTRIGLPHRGRWREILNSDAVGFGGAGDGNLGGVDADDVPWMGRPASAVVTIPALSAVWFAPE